MQDDPAMLHAGAAYFRKYHETNFKHHSLFQQITDTHPHPLKRAQKLEERAPQAELKQRLALSH